MAACALTLFTAPLLLQYAFNLFSHTTKIGENGYNEEEMKMVKETRKIWGVRVAKVDSLLARGARLASRPPLGGSRGSWNADDDYTHHYRPELRLSAGVDKRYAPLLRSSGPRPPLGSAAAGFPLIERLARGADALPAFFHT